MNELRGWLKDADPVASEPPLSDAEAQRMRRAMMAAAEEPAPAFAIWGRGSWAAVCVALAVSVALGIDRWSKADEIRGRDVADTRPGVAAPDGSTRRQIQLIAPGGTRVIWIFNEEFEP
jgi:uncharacterized iron-regulated membrane protein